MATLNELGRNSSSITYGPFATGQDLFPTLQAVDTWFRNDTWQGTATGSSTSLTGVGTIWTTQARASDVIMVAGQLNTVLSTPSSDTALTTGSAFGTAITFPSAVKAINPVQNTQTQGYVSSFARGSTNGTVYVTNGSSTISGVGTYFLTDATNSITTVAVTGTIAIDVSGNITGTSTSFQTSQPGQNGLYPGDSIAVTTTGGAVYYFIIATVTSDTAATVTVAATTAITGASISKATNGTVGRYININGRVRQITAIASNTSMTVNFAMDFTDSNLRYKVYPRGTLSNATTAAGTLYGSTSGTGSGTTLTVAATLTGYILPGAVLYASSGIPVGTTVVNQQWATSPTVNNTSVAGTTSTNTLTTSGTQTGTIVVGMIVTGSGAAVSGVPAGTYVTSITGTTPNFTITLSQNLTGTVSGQVYFAYPGSLGAYTTSQATTISGAAFNVSSLQGTGTNFFWDLGYQNLNNTAVATPYMYQTSLLDQVWMSDEVRTLNFSSFSGTITSATLSQAINCYMTDYVGYSGNATGILRQTVYLIPFKRDDTFINGNIYGTTTIFLSDLRVGDDLIINGTECTVTSIINNTQFKVNTDFTHTTANNAGGTATATTTYSSGGAPAATTFVVASASNIAIGQLVTGSGIAPQTYVTNVSSTTITISQAFNTQATGTYNFYNGVSFYKKLKLHGYVLEGTREGGTAGAGNNTKWTQSTTLAGGTGTVYGIGATTLTVTAQATIGPTYNFVKISGGGGTPLVLAGQINTVSASTTITGINTLFTSQLHIGAEIVVAEQYLTVTVITSDTSLTVSQTVSVTGPTPYYRSVPLYTYITAGTTTITLATPLKNNLYVAAANPPTVYYPSTGGDFIEYVYSAPNYNAQFTTAGANQSSTTINQSLDRKYVGFRMFPLFQSTMTSLATTVSSAITTAFGAYSTPVYERWVASYAQTHGVGINQADLSGGVVTQGSQTTTTYTITQPIAGSLTAAMSTPVLGSGYPQTPPTGTTGTVGTAGATYTTMGTTQTIAPSSIVAHSLYGVYDITAMSQLTGGFLYLFGNTRYFAIQGKTFSNIQAQMTGCIEYERAQPEDASTGTGTGGVTFGGTYGGAQLSQGASPPIQATAGFNQNVIQYTPGVAPWPCFAYFNGNRLPTGAQQIPTLPVLQSYLIHGCVLSPPRVRNSAGDLVGFNAHIYSSLTITTGRWGHTIEFGNYGGSYNPAYLNSAPTVSSSTLTNLPNSIPQTHMGQIVPVYTNVYNAKRFMFSPVVVLGPAYDPDVRGRIYGMKILPSNLGTLMDTVSITINTTTPTAFFPDYFYNTSGAAADHWVTTTPPNNMSTALVPGQQPVLTYRFALTQNASTGPQQEWRSLEDPSTQSSSSATLFVNNFRFAFPA
jgi:hypothetical protein